jgi:hypothetical protein
VAAVPRRQSSQTWLYKLDSIKALVSGHQLSAVRVRADGEVDLGSGETLQSAELPVEFLGPITKPRRHAHG